MRKLILGIVVILLAGCVSRKANYTSPLTAELPIIDAHSQADEHIELDKILALMNEAGVSRTILALRGRTKPEDLISFALRYPDRITPAVRTKGQSSRLIKNQIRKYQYGAMAEVLMWHREKTRHTVTRKDGTRSSPPHTVMPPDHPRSRKLLAMARKKNWPFIVHIEFGSAGADRGEFMTKLEDMMRQQPAHPFVLIHMGMLEFKEVNRLIEEHQNIYFIPAHSDPISVRKSDNPFTKMFNRSGAALAPKWKEMILRHPDRFILGFDNVWAQNWEKHYIRQVNLWRKALAGLPADVAHAVAHGNAERLWRLPPAQYQRQ